MWGPATATSFRRKHSGNSAGCGSRAYLFVPLCDLPTLRAQIRATAGAAGLNGTVLLAAEGINLSLAGPPAPLRRFVGELRADPRLGGLAPRESWSGTVPFRRLLVKCKREIIRMDHPAIRPHAGRAPTVERVPWHAGSMPATTTRVGRC